MLTCDDEPLLSPQLVARLRPIRLLCLDVDGVLSDGHLYFAGGEGDARFCQRFSVRDGVGVKLLQQSGRQVAILSEGSILSGRVRAESLGIRHAYFGLRDKVARFDELLAELQLAPEQAAFIGDAGAGVARCVAAEGRRDSEGPGPARHGARTTRSRCAGRSVAPMAQLRRPACMAQAGAGQR